VSAPFVLPWEQAEVGGREALDYPLRIYRLCPGYTEPELIALCPDEAAVGVALCTLGREGEFDPDAGDCAVGILDTQGETGRKWIVRPWLASPGNLADAGRVLRSGRADIRVAQPWQSAILTSD
jgi:hypothetical protein